MRNPRALDRRIRPATPRPAGERRRRRAARQPLPRRVAGWLQRAAAALVDDVRDCGPWLASLLAAWVPLLAAGGWAVAAS